MITVNNVAKELELYAPKILAESYDNVGLLIGSPQMEVSGILLTIDITEQTIDEALDAGANMIISHHPLIFSGLKSITGKSMVERIVIKAIKHDIAIYASHTNMDSTYGGVSYRMGNMLGLKNMVPLKLSISPVYKFCVNTPLEYADDVRKAIAENGGGCIGNYDSCTFSYSGEGRFRASEDTHPFVGTIGALHIEQEIKIETVVHKSMIDKVIRAVKRVHPYEEVAYDIIPTENYDSRYGLGVVGDLESDEDIDLFLQKVKDIFDVKVIRHSHLCNSLVKRVALCGGSGGEFISQAKHYGADIYITGDVKYHDFFNADNQIVVCDIGHFESEQYTIDIFYDVLSKKNYNFAICKSTQKSNPITYL